jgi:hypothetical protein
MERRNRDLRNLSRDAVNLFETSLAGTERDLVRRESALLKEEFGAAVGN